jgi:hypothetical protein
MNEPLIRPSELHKAHQSGQERHVYFLLAAAGAAVAFASQKTEGQALSLWLVPLGAAVLSWAASFYYGCKAVDWSHTTMRREIYLLQAREQNAAFEGTEDHHKLFDAHFKSLDDAIAKWSHFYRWQFRLLVIGGVWFCAWRVTELLRHTPTLQQST